MPLQAVDIAIIKATTAKFSVVPKEKHVRSEHRLAGCMSCVRRRGAHQQQWPELVDIAYCP